MEWRGVKSIPLLEVQRRTSTFSEKYGSISQLNEQFAKGRIPPGIFEEYIEWTNMDHALRAYQEGEDFEYLAEEELKLKEQEEN